MKSVFIAAPLFDGERSGEELGQVLLRMVVETACGKQTKAEALGETLRKQLLRSKLC